MTDKEQKIIRRFACGESYGGSLREQAVAIFHAALRNGTYTTVLKEKENPVKTMLLFMSEVDNKVPDLALRAMYRKKIQEMGAVL